MKLIVIESTAVAFSAGDTCLLQLKKAAKDMAMSFCIVSYFTTESLWICLNCPCVKSTW